MNIYELQTGNIKHFVAAEDEADAYKQGTDPEQHPDIHYLPFTVTQVEVPGHTITVEADGQEAESPRRGRKPKAS